MGGMNSCCIPKHQNPNLCLENHVSTPKSKKGHRHNVSAAFNLNELGNEIAMEQLNINTSTEEELMTLPGINRQTAQNIVDYRKQIGGFKKVEDMALVSGVGATKLSEIRLEICVRNKKISQNSSRSSSRIDMQVPVIERQLSAKTHSRQNSVAIVKVNVNNSNVFQLMKAKGISQSLAENIVAHRDKKGPFKSIDDVIKVKGVTASLLSAVRPYLVLEDEAVPLFINSSNTSVSDVPSTPLKNGSLLHCSPTWPASTLPIYPTLNGNGNYKEDIPHIDVMPTTSQDDLLAMYGPLLKRSFRHAKPPPKIVKRNLLDNIRIGSWNLQGLTKEKAENPGVKEVACLTILENGLSVLAVQEIHDQEALQKICNELNQPSIPNVKRWSGRKGKWNCITSSPSAKLPRGHEHLGFLFDTNVVSLVEARLVHSMDDSDVMLTTKPFISDFKLREQSWTFCNMHIGCYDGEVFGSSTEQLLLNIHKMQSQNLVIMGDISSSTLQEEGLGTTFTCSITSEGCSSLDGDGPFIDSILLSNKANRFFNGDSDVVQQGLSSPWIPKGWQWGGTISDHFPLWIELLPIEKRSSVEESKFSRSFDVMQFAKPLAIIGDTI